MDQQPDRLPEGQPERPGGRRPQPSDPARAEQPPADAGPPTADQPTTEIERLPADAEQQPTDLAQLAESRRVLDAQSEDRLPVPVRPAGEPFPVPIHQQNDLTTTMPILLPAAGAPDAHSAPPGEPGHFHKADRGQHRGGVRMPRGVVVAFGFVIAVGSGIALTNAFGGGPGTPPETQEQLPGVGVGLAPTGAGSPTPSGPLPSSAAATSTGPTPTPTPKRTHTSRPPVSRPPASATSAVPPPTSAASSPAGIPTTPPNSISTLTSTPSSGPTSATSLPLRPGDTGSLVSRMQRSLRSDCYLQYYSYQPGVFDQATEDAVKTFQDYNPGTADADGYGVYGPVTQYALTTDPNMGSC